MKKIIICAIAIGLASAVFADDGDEKTKPEEKAAFSFGVSGLVYGTSYNTVEKDRSGSYSAIRMRPTASLTKGDLTAVLKLEYDGTYGAESSSDNDSTENVGISSDKKGLEVMNAYITSKVAAFPGFFITAGIGSYDFPLVWGENAPLAGLFYEKDAFTLGLYYIKPLEGDNNTSTDDSQIYIADLTAKAGGTTLRPALFITRTGKSADDATYGTKKANSTVYQPAVSLSTPFGDFGFDATATYVTGKSKSGSNVKYRAYAFDIAPNYKVNETTRITGFFTLVSGDDNTSDNEETSFLNATIDGTNSGINLWRLFIIEDGGSFTENCDVCEARKYDNYNGYMAAGLVVETSFSYFTAKLQGAFIQAAKKPAGGSRNMGIEFDANIGYAIATGTTLYVEGAFLKTGKFYDSVGEKENAAYMNIGLKCEL